MTWSTVQKCSPAYPVLAMHDDVIKWKHFPRNWPFVREIHRSPVNFPHKGQWRGALTFSLIFAWINDWVNNREAGDLRRQHGHYDVIVMGSALTLLPLDKMAIILTDDIVKCISLNENNRNPIQISQKFVSSSPIDNMPALVKVMAWHRTGDKELSEPMLTQSTDTYIRHCGEMS